MGWIISLFNLIVKLTFTFLIYSLLFANMSGYMTKEMSPKEVKKIADLVALNLSKEESKKLGALLPESLSYVEVLKELDTKDVLETYQVTGLTNVFMNGDANVATLSQEDALSSSNEMLEDKFATEAVFDR